VKLFISIFASRLSLKFSCSRNDDYCNNRINFSRKIIFVWSRFFAKNEAIRSSFSTLSVIINYIYFNQPKQVTFRRYFVESVRNCYLPYKIFFSSKCLFGVGLLSRSKGKCPDPDFVSVLLPVRHLGGGGCQFFLRKGRGERGEASVADPDPYGSAFSSASECGSGSRKQNKNISD
jgi:hypothetical protein